MKRLVIIVPVFIVWMFCAIFSFSIVADNSNVWDGSIALGFASGSGSEEDPYIIKTPEELAFFADSVNSGNNYKDKYIVLANDIMLNDETFVFDNDTGLVEITDGTNTIYLGTGILGDDSGSNVAFDRSASTYGRFYAEKSNGWSTSYSGKLYIWKPIGVSMTRSGFRGHFNGAGHDIIGLFTNGSEYQGLFGYSSGTITNVGIRNAYVSGTNYVGGIVGRNGGTVSGCYNSGLVRATGEYSGGVTAVNDAALSSCYNSGDVHGYLNVGGVVGFNGSTVYSCYNSGSVSGYEYVGGIAGRNFRYGNISDSYSYGEIYGLHYVGGIAGGKELDNTCIITNCFYLNESANGGVGSKNNDDLVIDVDGAYTGLDVSKMKVKESYVGFDFETVWTINANYKNGYPVLKQVAHRCGIVIISSVVESTCTEQGVKSVDCGICGQNIETIKYDLLGHDYESVITEPTCTEKGYTTHTCTRCEDEYVDSYKPVADHTPGAAATCTKDQVCTECGEIVKAKLGHDYEEKVTKPTCTEKGYTTHSCTRCDDEYVDSYVAAQDHTPGDAATCTKDQICTACGETLTPKQGHDFEAEWTIDKEAAINVEGSKSRHCKNCDEVTDLEKIPALEKPAFNDVKEADWYYEAVAYAVSNGLFNGTGANTFSPDSNMNRAMLVTVLYRMEGSPSVAGIANSFNDVKAGQYYYDAVLWASSNGVVNGVGAGKFAPDANVTREQMATILYRYSEKVGIDVSDKADIGAFPDSSSVSSYAKDAIAWANGAGLIGGTNKGGKIVIDPLGNATRAQVATILMRYKKQF